MLLMQPPQFQKFRTQTIKTCQTTCSAIQTLAQYGTMRGWGTWWHEILPAWRLYHEFSRFSYGINSAPGATLSILGRSIHLPLWLAVSHAICTKQRCSRATRNQWRASSVARPQRCVAGHVGRTVARSRGWRAVRTVRAVTRRSRRRCHSMGR